MTQAPEIAYYYSAPFWRSQESGWIKSLLLFFDRVAILLPSYMYGRHEVTDPSLVAPLEDQGLLDVLDPTDWIDEEMTNQLAEVIVSLLVEGAFDELDRDRTFAELSNTRMGIHVDVSLTDMLVEELLARDLARPSEDGVSIPLHPTVRQTILVLLGQLSRVAGARRGLAVHPTSSSSNGISDLAAILSSDLMQTASGTVMLDAEPVTLNLDLVPLDEVLDFRDEHQVAHKTYMRDIRRFMADLAQIDDLADRDAELLERREEIADAARGLQRATRRAFRKNLRTCSLGIAGSAWSLAAGDPFGFILSAAGLTLESKPEVVVLSTEVVSSGR